jgi:hypothetical protein
MRVVIALLPCDWPAVGVIAPAGRPELRAADDRLHGSREPPAVPVQLRDHLVEHGLVGQVTARPRA